MQKLHEHWQKFCSLTCTFASVSLLGPWWDTSDCMYVSFLEWYLHSAGASFLLVLSSTFLPKATTKGGDWVVPAISCHHALKWCQVKGYGHHILECRLIQTDTRFLKDNTRLVFLALSPTQTLLLNFSLKKKKIQKTHHRNFQPFVIKLLI